MKFTVITLFPEVIQGVFQSGLVGQAMAKGAVQLQTINPRDFTTDVHHTVDDRTFGGGDGMVMKFEPLSQAVESIEGDREIFVLSPQGKRWSQQIAEEWSRNSKHRVLVCGRYAGIDHRFTIKYATAEISLGDFILNGGELAAAAMIESVARLRPGVLGNAVSALRDSLSHGLLECPQFTRPREVDGLVVPSPLLSGHHAKIHQFENLISRVRTAFLRPDLWQAYLSQPGAMTISKQDIESTLSLSDEELKSLGLKRESVLSFFKS